MIATVTTFNGTKMTTVVEAAKRLKVTPGRVRKFINEGRLKAERINSRLYLVDAIDLERFARLHRVPGNPLMRKNRTAVDN